MKLKMFLIRFQMWLIRVFRSKAFWYILALLITGVIIAQCSRTPQKELDVDISNQLIKERQSLENKEELKTGITKDERNNMVSVVKLVFDAIIKDKSYDNKELVERYNSIKDYTFDMKDLKRIDNGYSVIVDISVPGGGNESRVYVPEGSYNFSVRAEGDEVKISISPILK